MEVDREILLIMLKRRVDSQFTNPLIYHASLIMLQNNAGVPEKIAYIGYLTLSLKYENTVAFRRWQDVISVIISFNS